MRRHLGIVAAIAGALLLGACAKPGMEVGSITEIKAPGGSTGSDVYAARRNAGEQVPAFAGDQIVEVRTYHSKERFEGGGTGDEIAGARCSLTARDFNAEFTTPAKVRVPIYRSQSSSLAVKCEREDYSPKLIDTAAYDATNASRLNAGSSAGLSGLAFMAIVNALSDDSTHDFRYPEIKVPMDPVSAGVAAKLEKAKVASAN